MSEVKKSAIREIVDQRLGKLKEAAREVKVTSEGCSIQLPSKVYDAMRRVDDVKTFISIGFTRGDISMNEFDEFSKLLWETRDKIMEEASKFTVRCKCES